MTIISGADITKLLLAVEEVSPSPPGPGRSSEMCAEGMSHGGPGTTTQYLIFNSLYFICFPKPEKK